MNKVIVFSFVVLSLFMVAGFVGAADYVELFRCSKTVPWPYAPYGDLAMYVYRGGSTCDPGYTLDVNPGQGELGYLFSPDKGKSMKGVLPLMVCNVIGGENTFSDALAAKSCPGFKVLGYLYESKPACGDTAPLYLCKQKSSGSAALPTPAGNVRRGGYIAGSCDASWSEQPPQLLGYVLTGPKSRCIPAEDISEVVIQWPQGASPPSSNSSSSASQGSKGVVRRAVRPSLASSVQTSFRRMTGNFVALFH